jgi:ribonucleoside-diphosphate reductase alpha chain
VNLTYYVRNPFTPDAYFDFEAFEKNVQLFARMLDNVVEINGLPLEEQRDEIHRKRRHGMGYLGLGSAMIMLGVRYGSDASVNLTDKITRALAINNFRTGLDLAKKRGAAPVFSEDFVVTEELTARNESLRLAVEHGKVQLGETIKGSKLFVMSSYFKDWWNDEELADLLREISVHGSRFSHATSIAPTGTLALSFGNNASNGIEPSFSHFYLRNVIVTGEKTKVQKSVYSYEYMLYRELYASGALTDGKIIIDPIDDDKLLAELRERPEWGAADDIDPFDHVKVQAAAQKWIDSSISKTINVPTDYSFEQFQDIYMAAYDSGLKGCTTFRFNPEAFQGVLVKKEDLDATEYEFTTEDGQTFRLRGSDNVEYDGNVATAANLFEALKEGYYGKF